MPFIETEVLEAMKEKLLLLENPFIKQVITEALEKKHSELIVQLSIVRLKIHAAQTGDYSNLTEKMKQELEDMGKEPEGIPTVKYDNNSEIGSPT